MTNDECPEKVVIRHSSFGNSSFPPPPSPLPLARLARLALKELREILRDRRTIITLVAMPLLLYPVLALVFQRFLITSLTVDGTVEYVVGVDSTRSGELLANQLADGDAIVRKHVAAAVAGLSEAGRRRGLQEAGGRRPGRAGVTDPGYNLAGGRDHRPKLQADAAAKVGLTWSQDETNVQPQIEWRLVPADTERRQVLESAVHIAVVSKREANAGDDAGLVHPRTWQLYYRPGSPSSEAALRFVESRLRAMNEAHLDLQLRRMGVAAELPAAVTRHAVDFGGAPIFSIAALIPLILVLMTVTGAVYPAIDLTAGERERGTLEMLIAAPVPRVGLLLAKYVAVLTVALLTATVHLLGMVITSHSTGLNVSLFGGAGLTLAVIIKVLLLLGLFAAFFSAVLLAVTSYARSFKEAQAYIIPLMMLCLVPGIVCLMPSLQFTGPLAVIPLVNIVLLARDLLEGGVDPVLAAAAVFSNALYVVAAIGLAARIFGTDAILYGSQSTWSDIFRRPPELQHAVSPAAIMFALAVMFPCYFLLSSSLARSANLGMERRLLVCALVTALVFGAIPWAVARFNRVRLRSGIGLRGSSVAALLAAAILGAALWPAAHELFLLNERLGIWTMQSDQLASVKHLLDVWRGVPWIGVMVALAIAPGVFEELFFRGFLFSSLRSWITPRNAIVVSAVLFGLFHVVGAGVLAPERFMPSTFLGLVLGWVRYRSGSVLPCMALHAIHNGLLLSIVYWRDEFTAWDIGIEETAHMPASWLLLAAGATAIAVALLVLSTRRITKHE